MFFTSLLKTSPEEKELFALFDSENFEEFLSYIDEFIFAESDEEKQQEFVYLKAISLAKTGDFLMANNIFAQLPEEFAHMQREKWLGICEVNLGNIEEAEVYFRAVIESSESLHSFKLESISELLKLCDTTKKLKEVIESYAYITEKKCYRKSTRFFQSLCLREMGSKKEGIIA